MKIEFKTIILFKIASVYSKILSLMYKPTFREQYLMYFWNGMLCCYF